MISTQFGSQIKKFRTDNARDYFNHHLHNFFQQEGIIHEYSCVDTPQQNRVAERKIRDLLNVTRALLLHHSVLKSFWGEAVLTAAYLINRVPSTLLKHQSPIQCLSSYFPVVFSHTPLLLRVFGCVAFVHVSKHHRDKLDPRAFKCVFLGYSPTQKVYKCYHPTTRKFYVIKDVTFVENQ